MKPTHSKLLLSFYIIALPHSVRSGLQLDYADVPAPCVEACRPVAEISGICDVDADFDDNNEEVEVNIWSLPSLIFPPLVQTFEEKKKPDR